MILFIDNYDSFTYNLVDYIGQMEPALEVIRNDQIAVADLAKLKPVGIVISPGPGNPDDAGISCDVIKTYAKDTPILGVCLGFQAIGQVFGAKVIRASYPVHGKISMITHNGQGIFNNIKSPIEATRYHSLIVERASLPECLTITAETDDHLIMAMKHDKFPVYGVQFHPESILTVPGMQILENWIEIARNYIHNHLGDKS